MINPKNYTIAFHNLGCKVNAYEMEKMRESFLNLGFRQVPFDSPADIYVVNTCTVTNIADRKSRQMLHRARAMNPNACIAAVGCYVDTRGKEEVLSDFLDLAVPNKEKDRLAEMILEALENRSSIHCTKPIEEYAGSSRPSSPILGTGKPESDDKSVNSFNNKNPELRNPANSSLGTDSFKSAPKADTGGYTGAFLKAQDGCNMFCSYCVIPFARGRIKSAPIEDVVKEALSLAAKGCAEVVLTGIHLSSYGLDRPGSNENLQGLIEAVSAIQDIKRIRLSSLEPRIITKGFLDSLKGNDKLCPHFHLSLQSGSDSVLKRMNRRYTASEYREKVEMLRDFYHHPAITTDVIVGFPGETTGEFQETVDFLEEICLYETHVFAYSPRKGTRAASFPDQITQKVKQERSQILRNLGEKNKTLFEDTLIREKPESEILLEDPFSGYSKEYVRVTLEGHKGTPGEILKGKSTGRRADGSLSFSPDL